MDPIITAIINITGEDALTNSIGVTGCITDAQRKIMFDATTKGGSTKEAVDLMIITRCYIYGLEERPEDFEAFKHIFDADQLMVVYEDNWPRYPVLTVEIGSWDC